MRGSDPQSDGSPNYPWGKVLLALVRKTPVIAVVNIAFTVVLFLALLAPLRFLTTNVDENGHPYIDIEDYITKYLIIGVAFLVICAAYVFWRMHQRR